MKNRKTKKMVRAAGYWQEVVGIVECNDGDVVFWLLHPCDGIVRNYYVDQSYRDWDGNEDVMFKLLTERNLNFQYFQK